MKMKQSITKLSAALLLIVTLPTFGFTDNSLKCPNEKDMKSSQVLSTLTVYGYNSDGILFSKEFRIGIPANDIPSVWYENFKFLNQSYNSTEKILSCTYTADYRTSYEVDYPPRYGQWITVTNEAPI